MLGDICHCPGKKGADVARIVEKQCDRAGLNCYDAGSGTGDGGGENAGSHGVHVFFEDLGTGYVRKRCLPHISWRVADMAIKASGLDYKEFAAYLVDGVTWGRLRAIATQAPEEGGLGLFTDGSRKCKEIFSASPSAIIKNRPETDHTFLEFLKGKEHTLHLIADRDLQQRPSLGPEASKAALSLGDIGLRIFRTVLCEVIHRCLFLHYWASKHARVAEVGSWDELLEEAKKAQF